MKRKLLENIKRVEDRIEQACARSGRERKDLTLIAVTKSVSVDVIRMLVDAGIDQIGESRVQELTKRAAMIDEWLTRRELDTTTTKPPRPRWHMIGHLQRNKVKAVLPWTDLIHSVDSLRLAEEINTQAGRLDRPARILLEVNAAADDNKYGVAVAAATHLAEELATLSHLSVCGLMAMAPFTEEPGPIRYTYARMRELFDEIRGERICGPEFNVLSMGMSNDFEYAVEAGATHLRIGTALFTGITPSPQTMTSV